MNAYILADGVAKVPLWYSSGIGELGVANPSEIDIMNKNSTRVLSMVQSYRQHKVNV